MGSRILFHRITSRLELINKRVIEYRSLENLIYPKIAKTSTNPLFINNVYGLRDLNENQFTLNCLGMTVLGTNREPSNLVGQLKWSNFTYS